MAGDRQPAFMSNEVVAEHQRNYEVAKIITRGEMFLKGMIPIEDLDDEELQRGWPREHNGVFEQIRGKTRVLPATLREAVEVEHARRMTEKLRQMQDEALDTIAHVMRDDTAEPSDRFKASQYLFERVNGKTPDRIAVTVAKEPWQEVFEGIGQLTREQSRAMRAARDVLGGPGHEHEMFGMTIEGEVLQPAKVPYGHIQAPTAGDANLGDSADESGARTDRGAVPGLHTSGDWDDDQLTDEERAEYGTSTQQSYRQHSAEEEAVLDATVLNSAVLDGDYTVPREVVEPKYAPEPNIKVPDHNNPVNTMATAPNGRYVPPQEQERYAEPSVPLSQKLRDRTQLTADLAERRKEANQARTAAKDARVNASPERGKAKVTRIIKRNMGLDAVKPVDITADVQPVADGESRVRFRIT